MQLNEIVSRLIFIFQQKLIYIKFSMGVIRVKETLCFSLVSNTLSIRFSNALFVWQYLHVEDTLPYSLTKTSEKIGGKGKNDHIFSHIVHRLIIR